MNQPDDLLPAPIRRHCVHKELLITVHEDHLYNKFYPPGRPKPTDDPNTGHTKKQEYAKAIS